MLAGLLAAFPDRTLIPVPQTAHPCSKQVIDRTRLTAAVVTYLNRRSWGTSRRRLFLRPGPRRAISAAGTPPSRSRGNALYRRPRNDTAARRRRRIRRTRTRRSAWSVSFIGPSSRYPRAAAWPSGPPPGESPLEVKVGTVIPFPLPRLRLRAFPRTCLSSSPTSRGVSHPYGRRSPCRRCRPGRGCRIPRR